MYFHPGPIHNPWAWSWRPGLLLFFGVLLLVYGRGHYQLARLRHKNRPFWSWDVAAPWRPWAYGGGFVVLIVSLMSPVDTLGQALFFMHMIQHLLLVMVAPPLLLLANPFAAFIWGLPAKWRRPISRLLRQQSPFRRTLQKSTTVGLGWLAMAATQILWHDPIAYNLAITQPLVHDLEHITFFAGAFLFWWHIVGAAPMIHRQMPLLLRMGYALTAVPVTMGIGAALAFAPDPIYPHYTTVARLWGVTVMQDQIWAGLIMWVPGSMMWVVAALVLLARFLAIEEQKPPLPLEMWSTEEKMLAPGLEKR